MTHLRGFARSGLLLTAVLVLPIGCRSVAPLDSAVLRSSESPSSAAAGTDLPKSQVKPVTETADKPDYFAEIEELWASGRIEEARKILWSEDLLAYRDGSGADLWNLWRGRLYLRRWRGSDLGLAGENISSILAAGDDIWAGTWTGGLTRLSVPLGDFRLRDPGLPSKAVRTVNRILKNGEQVWTVRYGAVELYDLRSSRWIVEQGLPVSERLQDIAFQDQTMFLATLGEGLWRRDGRSWKRVPEPGLFINRMEHGERNELLVATMDRGLYLLDDHSWKKAPGEALAFANVTSALSRENFIIGGTYGSGAFIWNRDNDEVRYFDDAELGDPWVLAVAARGDWIYFATFGAGLNAWNIVSGEWDRLDIAAGLPNGDIASLALADDGAIWAGTLGGGIVRIDDGVHGD